MVKKYELVMETIAEYDANQSMKSSDDAAHFCMDYLKLHKKDREHFVVIGTNVKGDVIYVADESTGDLSGAMCGPKEIFKGLLLANCSATILVHNHPSGDVQPSQPDIDSTKRLVKAGTLLDIRVLDHVIIGSEGNYLSMNAEKTVDF